MAAPRFIAFLAACTITALGGTAMAAPTIDGVYDGAYGTRKAQVGYDASAPRDNFATPTGNSQFVAYDIYASSDSSYYYGFFQTRPDIGGTSAGAFANLYFDIDPKNNNGSDLGFEIGANGARAFVPGMPGYSGILGDIQVAIAANGSAIEFAIPISDFTGPIGGLSYYNGQEFISSSNPDVVLRLSQAFGYSVAGGASYGTDRLGRTTLAAPATSVPEPAYVLLLGTGLVGLMGLARRRRSRVAA